MTTKGNFSCHRTMKEDKGWGWGQGKVRDGLPDAEAWRPAWLWERMAHSPSVPSVTGPYRILSKPVTTSQGLLWDRPSNTTGSGGIFLEGVSPAWGSLSIPKQSPAK